MKLLRRRQFLSGSLALLALPTWGADKSKEGVPRPVIKVGDSWTYRNENDNPQKAGEFEDRVTFINGEIIFVTTLRKSDGEEILSTWTPEWNQMVEHSGRVFRPSTGFLRFPLRVGDSYETKFKWVRPERNLEGDVTAAIKMLSWEAVEVPAGKLRSIKFKIDGVVYVNTTSHPFSSTRWYAPDVGRWVKIEYEGAGGKSSAELVAYKLV